MSASKVELQALQKYFSDEIKKIKLKIWGRDPDAKITLGQISETAVQELRRTGDFYRKGDRIPSSALPAGTLTMNDIEALIRGRVNSDVEARDSIDEVVNARSGSGTLSARLALMVLASQLISTINDSEDVIDEGRIEGLSGKVDADAIIQAIIDSEEVVQIPVAKVDLSEIPGVVPIGSEIWTYSAIEPLDGNWKWPNGQQLLSAEYPQAAPMFAGVGSPDPGHFCLPDMSGKISICIDPVDGDLDAIFKTFGAKTVATSVAQTAKHSHNVSIQVGGFQSYMPPVMVQPDPIGTHEVYQGIQAPAMGNTGEAGNDEEHNNMPPVMVKRLLIRVR